MGLADEGRAGGASRAALGAGARCDVASGIRALSLRWGGYSSKFAPLLFRSAVDGPALRASQRHQGRQRARERLASEAVNRVSSRRSRPPRIKVDATPGSAAS